MLMWIVSQDGNSIINADRMHSIVKVDALIVVADGETSSTIGIYSTEEKAKAVMKQLIDSQVKFLFMKNTEAEPDLKEFLQEMQYGIISVKGNETEINSIGNQVFFMPQDEEVIA